MGIRGYRWSFVEVPGDDDYMLGELEWRLLDEDPYVWYPWQQIFIRADPYAPCAALGAYPYWELRWQNDRDILNAAMDRRAAAGYSPGAQPDEVPIWTTSSPYIWDEDGEAYEQLIIMRKTSSYEPKPDLLLASKVLTGYMYTDDLDPAVYSYRLSYDGGDSGWQTPEGLWDPSVSPPPGPSFSRTLGGAMNLLGKHSAGQWMLDNWL